MKLIMISFSHLSDIKKGVHKCRTLMRSKYIMSMTAQAVLETLLQNPQLIKIKPRKQEIVWDQNVNVIYDENAPNI